MPPWRAGFTLAWLLDELAAIRPRPRAPLLLMSYLNPLLAYGLERLPEAAAAAGVSGFIIPDLPHEESAELRAAPRPRRSRARADGDAGDAARAARDALRAMRAVSSTP